VTVRGASRLLLLRHGIAEDGHPDGDAARALTPRGRERTAMAMAGLASLGVAPDRILTSPLVRARQTAELAERVLPRTAHALEVTPALRPGADPAELLRRFAEAGGEWLCVGHAPHLDDLLALALGAARGGPTRLKKSGAACVAWDGPPRGPGRLVWLLPPLVLRRLGGE
jgi:phosphohistidine phosphatase